MFKCHNCKKPSISREKQNKVSLVTRDKTYVNPVLDDRGKQVYDDYGKKVEKVTTGFEIVREVNVCGKCI